MMSWGAAPIRVTRSVCPLAVVVVAASLVGACGGSAGDGSGDGSGRADEASDGTSPPSGSGSSSNEASSQAPRPSADEPSSSPTPAPPTSADVTPAPADTPPTPAPPADSPPASDLPGSDPLPSPTPEPDPEPSPISIEGCVYIGAYDRVFIFQRDAASGVCTDLGLVTVDDSPSPFDLANLALPLRWTIEDMSAFSCTPDGNPMSGTTATEFTMASGSIAFDPANGGLPSRVTLDVTILGAAADAELAPDPLIASQRIRADELELKGSCSSR
ncbi:MAG TPA: hypothetical protein VMG12_05190 [Polyangiaceae bacterium]|nr:hypothetical protein [Polyangiaceae bacterium]